MTKGNAECVLNREDRDVSLQIDKTGLICESRVPKEWNGVRGGFGIHTSGKYYYEATVTRHGLCRVGWASLTGSLKIGTDFESFGYEGTGKKSFGKKFDDYGKSFTTNDVLGCFLDLDNLKMWWSKNGEQFPTAYSFDRKFKNSNSCLFPAVLLQNSALAVNFGEEPFKFPPGQGFVAVSKAVDGNVKWWTAEEMQSVDSNTPLCVILEPTRELVQQTFQNIQTFAGVLKEPEIRCVTLAAGENLSDQSGGSSPPGADDDEEVSQEQVNATDEWTGNKRSDEQFVEGFGLGKNPVGEDRVDECEGRESDEEGKHQTHKLEVHRDVRALFPKGILTRSSTKRIQAQAHKICEKMCKTDRDFNEQYIRDRLWPCLDKYLQKLKYDRKATRQQVTPLDDDKLDSGSVGESVEFECDGGKRIGNDDIEFEEVRTQNDPILSPNYDQNEMDSLESTLNSDYYEYGRVNENKEHSDDILSLSELDTSELDSLVDEEDEEYEEVPTFTSMYLYASFDNIVMPIVDNTVSKVRMIAANNEQLRVLHSFGEDGHVHLHIHPDRQGPHRFGMYNGKDERTSEHAIYITQQEVYHAKARLVPCREEIAQGTKNYITFMKPSTRIESICVEIAGPSMTNWLEPVESEFTLKLPYIVNCTGKYTVVIWMKDQVTDRFVLNCIERGSPAQLHRFPTCSVNSPISVTPTTNQVTPAGFITSTNAFQFTMTSLHLPASVIPSVKDTTGKALNDLQVLRSSNQLVVSLESTKHNIFLFQLRHEFLPINGFSFTFPNSESVLHEDPEDIPGNSTLYSPGTSSTRKRHGNENVETPSCRKKHREEVSSDNDNSERLDKQLTRVDMMVESDADNSRTVPSDKVYTVDAMTENPKITLYNISLGKKQKMADHREALISVIKPMGWSDNVQIISCGKMASSTNNYVAFSFCNSEEGFKFAHDMATNDFLKNLTQSNQHLFGEKTTDYYTFAIHRSNQDMPLMSLLMRFASEENTETITMLAHDNRLIKCQGELFRAFSFEQFSREHYETLSNCAENFTGAVKKNILRIIKNWSDGFNLP